MVVLDSSSGGCDWQASDSPQCVPCALCPCDTGSPQALGVRALGVLSFCLFTRYIFLIIVAANRDVKAIPPAHSSPSFVKFILLWLFSTNT